MKSKKEQFEEISEKTQRYTKRTLLLVFGIIGVIFLILALIFFLCDVRDEEGTVMSLIFAPMGGFYVLVGLILYAVLPNRANYEKYEKRYRRFGMMSTYDMVVELQMLREEVNELQKKVKALEGFED